MTAGKDTTALLAAFAGLPGVDPDVIRQAQQAMADAMAAGVEQRALLDQQWAVMQATAAAIQGAPDQSVDAARQLKQARACFDLAVEAVRALNETALGSADETVAQVLNNFHEKLSRLRATSNK